MMTRLVILISGTGSNLIAIAGALRAAGSSAEIAAVVSNRPHAAGLEWASRNGLPTVVVDHRDYAVREQFDGALAERIAAFSPDWILLAGFMRVLGARFVDRFAGRIVNIHPSLLPAFPGLHTHRRALESGVRLHGATVHLVDHEIDHGAILAQAAVPVRDGDDEATLRERVLRAEHRLYPRVVGWLVDGRVRIQPGGQCELDVPADERLIMAGA